MRRTSVLLRRDMERLGEHVKNWRKIQGLTAQLTAERAGIRRDTLRSIERGESTTSESLFAVLRVLGQMEPVITSIDPLNTDLGRLNAARTLPQRVRLPKAR